INQCEQYCEVVHSEEGSIVRRRFNSSIDAEEFMERLEPDIFDIPLSLYIEKRFSDCYLFHASVDFDEKHVSVDPYILGNIISTNGSIRIPPNYIFNSKRVRMELLAGI